MKKYNLYSGITSEQKLLVNCWWNEFSKTQQDITASFKQDYTGSLDLAEWTQKTLNLISPNLFWEYGPGINKAHRLVITSESYTELRPLVRYILDKAPQYNDWEFYEYRLPVDFEELTSVMIGRCQWEANIISNIEFELIPAEYNTIDIIFYVNENLIVDGTDYKLFVLAENSLGEENLEKWIGRINKSEKSNQKTHANIRELYTKFNLMVEQQREKIPDTYINCSNTMSWSTYEIPQNRDAKVEDKIIYPRKQDLLLATFISGDIFPATYEFPEQFFSTRFSRNNEIFIYIKTDLMNVVVEEQEKFTHGFSDRGEFEDALTEALEEKSLGTVIGGGTGFNHTYIDLALKDLEASIETIIDVLKKGRISKNTWILFHDSDLQAEWIGIWDQDNPPPS